jgi:hypothetical protein
MIQATNPGMKGQPQAGLAALAQPAQAPRGMSSGSMQQIIARARQMSDSQLADILSGKSMDVPQYVAMTEAMGRRSLRNAVQGVEAQQQAKQPSVKEKLLAESAQERMAQMAPPVQGGIDQLPAPNMDSVDMASGGIVAFQDNEDQPVRVGMPSFAEGSETDKKILEFLKNAPGAVVEKFKQLNQPYSQVKPFEGTQAEFDAMVQRGKMPKRTAAETAVNVKDEEKRKVQLDEIARGQGVFPEGSAALPTGLSVPAAPPRADNTPAPKKAGLDALTQPQQPQQPTRSQAEQDYLAQLAGLSKQTRGGISDIKNQAQAQTFLDLSSALLGNRNLAEAGSKAGQLIAGRVGAMGKETRAVEREANEYDLNLAKSRAAFEAGDKDRAFKYQQAADENRYRMAMVNKPDSGIALLNALKDPKMMELYQQMNMAKKPTDTLDREKAAALWQKLTRNEKKDYGNDFETYFRGMNNQLLSATIPGQGVTTRPY